MSVRFGHCLSSYRVNVTSCTLCARAKVPGYRELKIEQNPSLVKLVEAFKFGSSSFNGDGVIQQSVQTGLERKKELRRQVKNKTSYGDT